MELTYYPSDGEGGLRGDGKYLPLKAQNDTVIVVSFAKEGDVEMYRGLKPTDNEDGNQQEAGTWKAGVQGGITLTAEVGQDHSCKMTFEIPPQVVEQIKIATQIEMPSTGTIYGHAYYSRYAGRGAFEIDSVDIQMDLEGDGSEMENVAGFSVVFEAVSATSVKVPVSANGMNMALEFKKQS